MILGTFTYIAYLIIVKNKFPAYSILNKIVDLYLIRHIHFIVKTFYTDLNHLCSGKTNNPSIILIKSDLFKIIFVLEIWVSRKIILLPTSLIQLLFVVFNFVYGEELFMLNETLINIISLFT